MSQIKRRCLLLLGARTPQLAAIRAAKHMDVRVVAVDPDPGAPGLALADTGYVFDLADRDSLLRLAKYERVDAVMTLAADYPMPVLAAICAELHLPGPSPAAVARATNKRLMRSALEAAGIGCPRYFHCDTLSAAMLAVQNLGCSAVFKPAMSHGGRGVTLVPAGSTRMAIDAAFARAIEQTRADGVMIEEFVDGPEFSVESLTFDGTTKVIAVTDKLTTGAPYFVEMGHNQPSCWGEGPIASLERTAISAVAALEADQAAGHTEIRLSSRGPIVIETAARLGGGFITSHLVPVSTGIDLVAATILLALGESPDITPHGPTRAAAIRFLHAAPGPIRSIAGLERIRTLEEVISAEIYFRVGHRIGKLVDSRDRVGHVICTGASPQEAILRAEDAIRAITIESGS